MGIQARGILRGAMGLHGASAAGAGMASLWSCMEDSHVNSKCQSHLHQTPWNVLVAWLCP